MKWINVRDAMPELQSLDMGFDSSDQVLGFGPTTGIRIVVWERWDDGVPEWHSCCSEHWNLGVDRITHWMPLPSTEGL